jgi:hypothetical protein
MSIEGNRIMGLLSGLPPINPLASKLQAVSSRAEGGTNWGSRLSAEEIFL